MRLFTCTDHSAHYPVGVASVILAEDEAEARELLDAELVRDGLRPFSDYPYTLQEISLAKPQAIILDDGNY